MKTLILAAIRCSLMFTAVVGFSLPCPAKANLITNGGFETGDFTGWRGGRSSFVTGTIDGISPHSGNFQAASKVGGLLDQPVPNTIPGRFYTINFWLANAAPLRNSFSAVWQSGASGATLLSLVNQAEFGYTEYTFNVIATGG